MRTILLVFILSLMTGSLFAQSGTPASRQTAPTVVGTLIVLNKSDHTVTLIDAASKKSLATIPTGKHPHEVAISPDGTLAVVADYGNGPNPGNTLTVIDIPGMKQLKTVSLGDYRRPHGIEWVKDNTVAVTVEANKALLLVDIQEGNVLHAIVTGENVSHMVVVTKDLSKAFVANIGSGTTTVLDLNANKKLADIETGAGAEGIAITPDGKEVWVTNRSANTVSVIDAATHNVLATLESKAFPIRVKITPDGKHALVSSAQSGEVVVFDVKERKEIRRIKMEFSPVNDADQRLFGSQFGTSLVPVGILIEPSGSFAYVANTQADVVTVIDMMEWKIADRLVAGKEPDGLGFSSVAVKR
ncbi:MAG: beta-propeller fold lactonase family protein [Ignavibacteriae bacterium]|nr:beta-propeller fold lactonase family protein [Ignavibacteriota bacterium]